MLYINIELGDSYKKKKLIDGISELCSKQNDPPAFSLSNLASLDSDINDKKGKKEKKKKKKKSKGQLNSFIDDEVVNEDEADLSGLMDVDSDKIKLLLSEGEDNVADIIIGEGRDYNKYKKSNDKLEERFGAELSFLYDLLGELNDFGKQLDNQFKYVSGSKARGMSKTSNDLTANIISNKKTKLDVVKEIATVKKIIEELKYKNNAALAKSNASTTGGVGSDAAAAAFMSNIMKMGRNNFIDALEANDENYSNYKLDAALNNLTSEHDNDWIDNDDNKGSYDGYYDLDESEEIDDMIDRRLQEEDYEPRTVDGDKYIMYENQQPKIFVKKCIDTGDWHFIAVNKDNQELVDYPLPDESLGKMKFSSDGNIATDKYGRTYKVIEYYSDEL